MRMITLTIVALCFISCTSVQPKKHPPVVTLCGVIENLDGTNRRPVKVGIEGVWVFKLDKPSRIVMVVCDPSTPLDKIENIVEKFDIPQEVK